jgi:hypothetical protein
MGDPELRNDEKVLVRTPGVYVKSIPFEGILTNKRVILVDRAKNLLPPKEIPLATVKEVETGENAIRDQILTLSVVAKTGDTRQMILTFSRQEGGNRVKERDEWARYIRANLGSSFEEMIRQPEPATTPRISVVNTPFQPVPVPSPAVREFDASTLGQNVFCSRCGNKVPADSAFCNRCGSPVIAPKAAPAAQPFAPAAGIPVPSLRPIDRDIQTIEPLIERSTVKIPTDPLRTVPAIPVHQPSAWDAASEPSPVPVVTPAPANSASVSPAEQPEKKGFFPRLFSPKARTQAAPAPLPSAAPPMPQKPRRRIGFAPSRNLLLGIGAIIAILVIIVVGVVFVYPMLTSGESTPTPGTTVAPTPTTTSSGPHVQVSGTFVVPTETPAPDIPPTGVQVHVNYIGGFKGTYGLPAMLATVPGNSGDRVWEVENATGTVTASFEKTDGSSHELLVEIYKNGVPLTKGTTTIGHGTVVLSVDTTTGIAATPVTSGGGSAAVSTTTKPAANTTATVKTTTLAANTTAKP